MYQRRLQICKVYITQYVKLRSLLQISLLNERDESVVVKAKCEREELTSTDKTYAMQILTNYYQDTSTVTKVTSVYI